MVMKRQRLLQLVGQDQDESVGEDQNKYNRGHNAIISAGSVIHYILILLLWGVQTGKLQATSVPGPNGGNHYIIKYKDTTNTPVNRRNLRLRVNLSTTKAVTFQYVNNAEIGGHISFSIRCR